MARRGWRYIAQRLTGDGGQGEFLDWDLPLEDVEIEDVLSGHNALRGVISPRHRRLTSDSVAKLAPYETAIWAENDGDIRGGGILVNSPFEGANWELECVGYTGYAQDLPYGGGWYGVEVDPLDVARHIWAHIQSQPGGDLGLEVSQLKTGLKIGTELKQVEFDTESGPVSFEAGPYKLAWYQDHNLADNIDKLAEDTPFDYHERHYWDGEAIRHRLDFGYPRLGRKRDDLRFVFGENIQVLPSISMSGEDYATEAMVLGAGEGAKMKKGQAYRPRRGLRRVAIVSDPSLRSKTAVVRRAEAEIQWRKQLDDINSVEVRDTPHARLGEVGVGDTIILAGRASEWKSVELEVRVLSITMSPGVDNRAIYSVARTDRLDS